MSRTQAHSSLPALAPPPPRAAAVSGQPAVAPGGLRLPRGRAPPRPVNTYDDGSICRPAGLRPARLTAPIRGIPLNDADPASALENPVAAVVVPDQQPQPAPRLEGLLTASVPGLNKPKTNNRGLEPWTAPLSTVYASIAWIISGLHGLSFVPSRVANLVRRTRLSAQGRPQFGCICLGGEKDKRKHQNDLFSSEEKPKR